MPFGGLGGNYEYWELDRENEGNPVSKAIRAFD
jgi:hypothetical protein